MALGSCLGSRSQGPKVDALQAKEIICCFFLLCLKSSLFRGIFLRLIFIYLHVTGWCNLAYGFGKIRSVAFIQAVPLSAPSIPLSVGPLSPLCTEWHSPSSRLWTTPGPCSSQDSALERTDYRSPGKL